MEQINDFTSWILEQNSDEKQKNYADNRLFCNGLNLGTEDCPMNKSWDSIVQE